MGTSRNLLVYSLACFLLCARGVRAQETSLDLRTDGRIIAGARLEFLLQRVMSCAYAHRTNTPSQLALELSESLHNKLLSSKVVAIVVPQGQTDDKFKVGLLIGSATLPADEVVTESDFNTLRSYSKSLRLASIEAKYREIRLAACAGRGQEVAAKTAQLRAILAERGADKAVEELYAGYLVAELAGTSEMAKVADLVTKYRTTAESVLNAVLQASIEKNEIPLVTPVAVLTSSEYSRPLTVGEFLAAVGDDSSAVKHQPSTPNDRGYLKVWRGRSLVVIVERPEAPFNPGQYKSGVAQYVNARNLGLRKDAIITELGVF